MKALLILFISLIVFSCNNNPKLPQVSKNEIDYFPKPPPVFYKPHWKDRCWYDNEPNLIGAEGWIHPEESHLGRSTIGAFNSAINRCGSDTSADARIKIFYQSLSHAGHGRGRYEGKLYFNYIDTPSVAGEWVGGEYFYDLDTAGVGGSIDFDCFLPDYDFGDWICPKKESNKRKRKLWQEHGWFN